MTTQVPVGGSRRADEAEPAAGLFIAASVSGFCAVAVGAFGAHALRQSFSTELATVYETGVRYQMFHTVAMFVAGWSYSRFRLKPFLLSGWLFLGGTLLFSGSLYALALTGIRWLGAVTPLGGTAFLSGWGALAYGFWKLARKR